jgi:16S rRNA (guanine527-N7)-methyltransferase
VIEDLLDVSRETLERLRQFESLVKKWNPAINLVSPNTIGEVWERHILDSIQIFRAVNTGRGHWADLGSGGGFPGAVVAILAAEEARDLRITCVESDMRKATFLRTVSRETSVPFRVLDERIEKVAPLEAEVVSARALAPLDRLLDYVSRHLAPEGVAILPKGLRHEQELAEARKVWDFELETVPSRLESSSVILKLTSVRHV